MGISCVRGAAGVLSLLAAGALIASVHAAEPTTSAGQPTGVAWQPSLRAAYETAVREKKPILLVFGAEWCHFCKKLEQETLSHPALARYINSTYVAVHLDYDKHERVRQILGVEKLPCTVLLTTDAEILDRFEGFLRPAEVHQKLEAARQVHLQLQQTIGTEAADRPATP